MQIDIDIEDLDISATQRRKLKRKERKNKALDKTAFTNISMRDIKPKTINQKFAFEAFEAEQNLLLHGCPGTGKTFISIYLAMRELLSNQQYSKLVLVRSVVPTRDMGFLPGSIVQKSEAFETPYNAIFTELSGRGDAYQILKNKGLVEFMTTSFIRGITLDNCIVIVDEIQNMSFQELHSIMTRLGSNSRVIFCGDMNQDDLTSERYSEKTGINSFMDILTEMDEFDFINFEEDDIVRSGIVKSYILASNKLGY